MGYPYKVHEGKCKDKVLNKSTKKLEMKHSEKFTGSNMKVFILALALAAAVSVSTKEILLFSGFSVLNLN